MNRRELVVGMPALAAALRGVSGTAQTSGTLAKARVFSPRGEMKTLPNGGERWQVAEGALVTGETVALHESVMPAGTPAPALHRIMHTEFIVLMEGTVEFAHDGTTETVEAGSVMYVACGTSHYLKNVGSGPARYMVIGIGGDTKRA